MALYQQAYIPHHTLLIQRLVFYDVWWSGSAENFGTNVDATTTTVFKTGSIKPETTIHPNSDYDLPSYVTNISNLKKSYSESELARFRLFTRLRNWNPTIYTVASNKIENYQVEDAYYKIYRVIDNYDVIEYGTGSLNHTRLSYDVNRKLF